MKRTCVGVSFFVWCMIGAIAGYPTGETASRDQLDFANGLFMRKMYDMALVEYQKYSADFPDSPERSHVEFMIAEAYFYLRVYDTAYTYYESFAHTYPAHADRSVALMRAGICLLQQGKAKEACERFAIVPRSNFPSDLLDELLYYKGLAFKEIGDYAAAIEQFDIVLKEYAASQYGVLAALQRGAMCLEQSMPDQAIRFFEQAAAQTSDALLTVKAMMGAGHGYFARGQYDEAAERFRRVVAMDTGDQTRRAHAALFMIRSYIEAERLDDAIAAYALLPVNDFEPASRADLILMIAQCYVAHGDYTRALASFDMLLAENVLSDSDRKRIVLEKMNVLLAHGDSKGVLELMKAGTVYADDPEYLFLRAEALYYQKEYDDAQVAYYTIVNNYTASPYYIDALRGLGFCFLARGEHVEAHRVFSQYVVTVPSSQASADVLYSLITLDNTVGKITEGITHATTFLERYPEHANSEDVLYLLAHLYLSEQRYQEAIRTAEQYVSRFPSGTYCNHVYFILGYAYYAIGQAERSNESYMRVTRTIRDEDHEDFYYAARRNMVSNYITSGNTAAAAGILESLIKEYPQNDLETEVYWWLVKYFSEISDFERMREVITLVCDARKETCGQAEVAFYRAEAERGLGNIVAAAAQYDASIAADETGAFRGASYIGKGILLRTQKNYEAARDAFNNAINVNPDDISITMRARFALAETLADEKKFDEAARMFMMVTILYADERYVRDALFRAAELFYEAGHIEEARRAYESCRVHYPDDERCRVLEEKITHGSHETT